MEVDKTLNWIGWPTRCAGAFRYAWLFSSNHGASRANIVRAGFQTLSIIPQRHGGRVNRAVFIDEPRWGARNPPSQPILSRRFLEGWQSSPFFHDPKISSRSHGKIEKLTPLLAGVFERLLARIAPSAHTRFPLYDTPRRFRAMPRFRWIFRGRIHNVHLCTGQ